MTRKHEKMVVLCFSRFLIMEGKVKECTYYHA